MKIVYSSRIKTCIRYSTIYEVTEILGVPSLVKNLSFIAPVNPLKVKFIS